MQGAQNYAKALKGCGGCVSRYLSGSTPQATLQPEFSFWHILYRFAFKISLGVSPLLSHQASHA
jgi:hypothetical protein